MTYDELKTRVHKALVLTAHADDCEFFAGGLVARLARDGVEVAEIIATDNGRGSFELDTTELVAQSRDREAREAARIMGKTHLDFLGYPDGFLDDTPKNELRRRYMEIIRDFKPDLLISFDATDANEEHPDHRHVARAALEAVSFCHLPLYHPEQAAGPHLTPYRLWFAKHPAHTNLAVDVDDFMDTVLAALWAHESQMRMMVEDLKRNIGATGVGAALLPLLDPDNYRPVLDMMMRLRAGNTAKSVSWPGGTAPRHAEVFRLETVTDLLNDLG